MELRRRAADTLFGSHTSPIALLLSPVPLSRCLPTVYRLSAASTHRSIHSSRNLGAGSSSQPPITTSAETPAVKLEGRKEESSKPLGSLGSEPLSHQGGPQQAQDKAGERPFLNLNRANSATDLLLQGFSQPGRDRTNRFNLDRMESPMPVSRASELMKSMTDGILAMPKPQKFPIKLNSSTGRSVLVGGGTDVGLAFRLLQSNCIKNRIPADFSRQRFHERPGMKKKRLKAERWRRRFKVAFRSTVARVKELRRQGW